MILLCPPEKSTQFHYPLDPKKIRTEGSMHKDTTYQGSDRQDFYRHGKKKKLKKRKKRKQTNKTQTSTGFAHRQPSNNKEGKIFLTYGLLMEYNFLAPKRRSNNLHKL